jgi:hypothetical protein
MEHVGVGQAMQFSAERVGCGRVPTYPKPAGLRWRAEGTFIACLVDVLDSGERTRGKKPKHGFEIVGRTVGQLQHVHAWRGSGG